jgi:hypothetical protein
MVVVNAASVQVGGQLQRSNKMRLSRSLRALDLDGLEHNLADRKISAHWDLENSRW